MEPILLAGFSTTPRITSIFTDSDPYHSPWRSTVGRICVSTSHRRMPEYRFNGENNSWNEPLAWTSAAIKPLFHLGNQGCCRSNDRWRSVLHGFDFRTIVYCSMVDVTGDSIISIG